MMTKIGCQSKKKTIDWEKDQTNTVSRQSVLQSPPVKTPPAKP